MSKRGNNEGSIYYQKSRERWAGVVTLDGGKRKVLYGKTRQDVAHVIPGLGKYPVDEVCR